VATDPHDRGDRPACRPPRHHAGTHRREALMLTPRA
jgi:hypothetical protein